MFCEDFSTSSSDESLSVHDVPVSKCNSEPFKCAKNRFVHPVHFKDKHGNTPLHRAVTHPNCTWFSVKKYLNKRFINVKNSLGHTPLHSIIMSNCQKILIIHLLILKGADINAVDCNGSTVLHKALQNPKCSVKLINLLIKNKAYLAAKQYGHETPLMFAVRSLNPNLKIIKKLMYRGCINVCAKYTENHNTLRILCSNLVLIKMFLQYSTYNGEEVYSDYETIIELHCFNSVCGFKSLLGSNSAATDLATALLIYAVNYPSYNMDVIKELLKKGASIDSRNCKQRCALYYALRNPHCSPELIQELIKYERPGMQWNLLDLERNSFLHIAAANRNCPVEVMKKLLKKGINLNQENQRNLTPLDCAADFTHYTHCNLEVIEVLLLEGGSTYKSSIACSTIDLAMVSKDMCVLWKNIQVLSSPDANRDVLDCTKLLVKYVFVEGMSRIQDVYANITKLCARFRQPDKCGYFAELTSYLNVCFTEIIKMVDTEFSFRGGINDNVINQKVFTLLVSNQFPLYCKLLVSLLEKSILADNVSGVPVYTVNEEGYTSYLNAHCLNYLMLHLKNEELFNLYLAFKDQNDIEAIQNTEEMQIEWIEQLNEPEEGSCSIMSPKKKCRLH